jgi:hypothetical protein
MAPLVGDANLASLPSDANLGVAAKTLRLSAIVEVHPWALRFCAATRHPHPSPG